MATKNNARTNNGSKKAGPSAWDRMKATGSAVAENQTVRNVAAISVGAALLGAAAGIAVKTYEGITSIGG